MKDYYKLLQVDRGAEAEVIQKAYRALCLKWHPDRHPADGKTEAEARMQELNEAYKVIGDPAKRAEYDRKLRRQEDRTQPSPHEPTAPERPATETEPVVTGDAESDWNAWARHYFDLKEDFINKVYTRASAEPGRGRGKKKRRTSWWRRKKRTDTDLTRGE